MTLQTAVATDVAAFTPQASDADWLEVYKTGQVEATPRAAWDSFKTFGSIDAWHPATMNCGLILGDEGVPGAVREFQVQGGGEVMSELLAYDEDAMSFRYRILKTNLPLYSYIGAMWVEATADGGAVVHWKGEFQRPKGSDASENEATIGLVTQVFEGGIAGIQAKLA